MRKIRQLLIALFVIMTSTAFASNGSNTQTSTEVEAGGNICRVTFYTPDIVRVTKAPVGYTYKEQKMLSSSPSTDARDLSLLHHLMANSFLRRRPSHSNLGRRVATRDAL